MDKIKLDDKTKSTVKNDLEIVEATIMDAIKDLTKVIHDIDNLTGNPAIQKISQETNNTKMAKETLRNDVQKIKEAIDGNLEEFLSLDEEISNTFGGW